MLLRSGGDRGARRTVGDGLLPLRELPALFRRTGERVHVMEMGGCEPHQRRGVPGEVQEQRHQRSPVLHQVRQPHLSRSSNSRFDRRPHRSSPEFSVQTKGSPQLRRNSAADERTVCPSSKIFPHQSAAPARPHASKTSTSRNRVRLGAGG